MLELSQDLRAKFVVPLPVCLLLYFWLIFQNKHLDGSFLETFALPLSRRVFWSQSSCCSQPQALLCRAFEGSSGGSLSSFPPTEGSVWPCSPYIAFPFPLKHRGKNVFPTIKEQLISFV